MLGACWSFTKVCEFLGHVDLFCNFHILLKEERKTKWISWDLGPLLGPFLGFGEYVMGMGCRPMDLPMFMPILYV